MSFLAKINFGRPRKRREGEAEDAIDGYLAALIRNGQIAPTYIVKIAVRWQAMFACHKLERSAADMRRHG